MNSSGERIDIDQNVVTSMMIMTGTVEQMTKTEMITTAIDIIVTIPRSMAEGGTTDDI